LLSLSVVMLLLPANAFDLFPNRRLFPLLDELLSSFAFVFVSRSGRRQTPPTHHPSVLRRFGRRRHHDAFE